MLSRRRPPANNAQMHDRPTQRKPLRAAPSERIMAALAAGASLAILLVAVWLKPAEAGHGTHEQLGLHPCVWASTIGQPCPTCGMTTSFALAARADFFGSFQTQPLGFMLALCVASAFWIGLHISLTGSTIAPAIAGLLGTRALWVSFAALIAAWVYKIGVWQGL